MDVSNEREKLQQIRHRFISVLAQNIGLYGISETNGRLYGTILFSNKPMTLDDMSKALGMSKTSMSTGVRALSEADMVTRVWEKGNRKDLYETEDDWYKSFISVFINRWREGTDKNKHAATRAKEALEMLLDETNDEDLIEEIKQDIDKLEGALHYYEWLDEVIHLFESGDIFKLIPKK